MLERREEFCWTCKLFHPPTSRSGPIQPFLGLSFRLTRAGGSACGNLTFGGTPTKNGRRPGLIDLRGS